MQYSDWINLSLALTSLASLFAMIWIGSTLQRAITSERAIKDFLIKNIEEINKHYKSFYADLLDGKIEPKHVLQWFKSFNVEIEPICNKLSEISNCNYDRLSPFRHELREIITEDEDFINSFNKGLLEPSVQLRLKIQDFHKRNYHIFIDLICEINYTKI